MVRTVEEGAERDRGRIWESVSEAREHPCPPQDTRSRQPWPRVGESRHGRTVEPIVLRWRIDEDHCGQVGTVTRGVRCRQGCTELLTDQDVWAGFAGVLEQQVQLVDRTRRVVAAIAGLAPPEARPVVTAHPRA